MHNINNIGQKIAADFQRLTTQGGANTTKVIAQWRQHITSSPAADPLIETDSPQAQYETIEREIACLAHYILPAKNGYQVFKEFSTGDVIIDFCTTEDTHDLKNKDNLCFLIGGEKYVTKKVGRNIDESWDIRLHDGNQSMISLLLTKQV